MGKKMIIAVVALIMAAGIGVGTFFIIKNISDEQHKKDIEQHEKDIEMAADCARTFDEVYYHSSNTSDFYAELRQMEQSTTETANRRRAKRQECAEKYNVTHQEIIDKIGTDNYSPK